MLAPRRHLDTSTPSTPPAPMPPEPLQPLSRPEKLEAQRQIQEVLSSVGTGWTFVPKAPPPPPAPAAPPGLQRGLSLRSGGLGSWSSREPSLDAPVDEWESESDSSSGSFESTPGSSYRRPDPGAVKKKKKRRRRRVVKKRREGVWAQRIDDSDFEVPGLGDAEEDEEDEYRWETPDSVPSGEEAREKRRKWKEGMMRDSPGLRIWWERREAWTNGDGEDGVPVGQSRFQDNALTKLVVPSAYKDIYQKCVVQSHALPVPINLKTMTDVLVEGWKRDDEWPPHSQQPQTQAARDHVLVKELAHAENPRGGKLGMGRFRKLMGMR